MIVLHRYYRYINTNVLKSDSSNCYQNVIIIGDQIRPESITHDCNNYEDSRKENDFLEQ